MTSFGQGVSRQSRSVVTVIRGEGFHAPKLLMQMYGPDGYNSFIHQPGKRPVFHSES